MNFNKEVTILKPTRKDDGYGGNVITYTDYKTIKANTAPAEEKVIATDGSLKIYSLLKIFTKDLIDIKDFRIKYNDVLYKHVSTTDYSKVILYKMEKL